MERGERWPIRLRMQCPLYHNQRGGGGGRITDLVSKPANDQVPSFPPLLSSGESYSNGGSVKPNVSEFAYSFLRIFHRSRYDDDRESRRCGLDECYRNCIQLPLREEATTRPHFHIEAAHVDGSKPDATDDAPHPMCPPRGDTRPSNPISRRRNILRIVESGWLSGISQCVDLCVLDNKHVGRATSDVSPSRWHVGDASGPPPIAIPRNRPIQS